MIKDLNAVSYLNHRLHRRLLHDTRLQPKGVSGLSLIDRRWIVGKFAASTERPEAKSVLASGLRALPCPSLVNSKYET